MSYQGTGIVNPMPNATPEFRVMADIDKEVWEYFFKGVFAGRKGPRQAMICTFFLAFHQACIADGIQATWDVDNEQRVGAVLQRLNFNPPVEILVASKPKRKAKNV